jgi:predicted SprT family Zn-dependent metalloprotease
METLQANQKELIWSTKKTCNENEIFDLLTYLMERTWDVNGQTFNLRSKGWTWGFNTRKVSLGVCKLGKRKIELSLEWIRINQSLPSDFEDVIRHEIAHAIDYHLRGTSKHDAHWKRICVQIGADPTRLYDNPDAKQPKGKYTLVCDKCGTEIERHRKPKRASSCAPCGNGRYDANLKLRLVQNW